MKGFAKGVSGNPGGRPKKGWSISELIQRKLDADPELRDRLINKAIDKAASGDVPALKEIMNRLEGQAPQTINQVQSNPFESKIWSLFRLELQRLVWRHPYLHGEVTAILQGCLEQVGLVDEAGDVSADDDGEGARPVADGPAPLPWENCGSELFEAEWEEYYDGYKGVPLGEVDTAQFDPVNIALNEAVRRTVQENSFDEEPRPVQARPA